MFTNAGKVKRSQVRMSEQAIMTTNTDVTNSYHCVVPIELSKGRLRFWFSEMKIEVLSLSRDEFSFVVPKNQCSKIHLGKKYRLDYRNEEWDVECVDLDAFDDSRNVVVVRRLQDRTHYKTKQSNVWLQTFGNIGKNADPMLILPMMIGFTLTFLLLPGWGEDLGTTQPITQVAQSIYETVRQAFRD
jgi:hypothetical protein